MDKNNFFDFKIFKTALGESFKKLSIQQQIKNPVLFIVYLSSIAVTIVTILKILTGVKFSFDLQITVWLWFTLLFANFSEAIAEGQGKARAESLRKNREEIIARKLEDGKEQKIAANHLKLNDLVVCEAGDIIPCDGEIIEGIACIDESAITGESAPVIRESGGDRSSVIIGTRVISDKIIIRVAAERGNTFLDKMIQMIEGAKRQKTPNEIALTILLSSLSLIFLVVVVTLYFIYRYTATEAHVINTGIEISILVSLLVCLIPTTIGALLNAIGISGIERLLKRNIIAKSGKAIETAGDIDVILLDKTGTITHGNRQAHQIFALPDVPFADLLYAIYMSTLSDNTPEGHSIMKFIHKEYSYTPPLHDNNRLTYIPFSAATKMSGVEFLTAADEVKSYRKGAVSAVKDFIKKKLVPYPQLVDNISEKIAREGGTPLIVIEDSRVLGVIYLKDIIKKGIKERFMELRKMGIKTVMITGDNALTAATIAAEAGVDDFVAEATPESKLMKIKSEQNEGHLVAMIGDGTNDAPALAQADVGVAMNSGTQTAKEAGNMIDLDNNPTKLIEIVETGKELLITRGSLTTFSIANDVAKYFAIIPAIFSTFYLSNQGKGVLSILNLMQLQSPNSAILSCVIFNALIIIALIPLALKGTKYKPMSAARLLLKNILIYGLGGLVLPFIGIKIIDLIINFLGVI